MNIKVIGSIAKHTIIDQTKQKSFIGIFILSGIFILIVRSCFGSSMTVNGQTLDTASVVWGVSKTVFHIIATGMLCIAALLAMGIMKRTRDEGMLTAILSRPVAKAQFLTGTVLGLWGLTALFMFVLHGIVLALSWNAAHAVIPGYLAASALISLNLLLVVTGTILLSLYLPDMISFLAIASIGLFSYISEGIYAASQTELVKQVMQNSSSSITENFSFWKGLYLVWPKFSGLQNFAGSLIEQKSYVFAGYVHPVLNLILYTAAASAGLYLLFRKRDVL